MLAVALPQENAVAAPIAIRLIGVLDRVLIESFSDACAGLAATGRRTFIVALRDLTAMKDESLTRFIATLEALRDGGHDVRISGRPGWRKLFRPAGAAFADAGDLGSVARRQIIIAQSSGRRSSTFG